MATALLECRIHDPLDDLETKKIQYPLKLCRGQADDRIHKKTSAHESNEKNCFPV
jgi:hypothetical protein